MPIADCRFPISSYSAFGERRCPDAPVARPALRQLAPATVARQWHSALWRACLRVALVCAVLACLPVAYGQSPANPAASAPPGRSGTEWPTFRGDAAQTGNSPSPLAGDLKLLWTYESKELISSTAAIQGGAVYVGTDKGRLLALDLAGGQLKWQYKAQGAIAAAPGVRDGKVFVGDRTGVFHAVNAETGAKAWTYETEGEIISSANFFRHDVLFGSYDNNLYCLSAETGKAEWKFTTDYVVHCSPCIAEGWARSEAPPLVESGVPPLAGSGVPPLAVIAGCDSRLRFIDLAKGTESGSIALSSEQDVASSPAFDGERIYISTCDRHLLCVASSPAVSGAGGPASGRSTASGPNDSETQAQQQSQQLHAAAQARGEEGRTGSMTLRKVWDIVIGGELEFHASPALSSDRVIFAGQDGLVRCLAKADGKPLWTFRTRGEVNSSPVIAGDRVFFGSGDGTLYAVKLSDGREVWSFRTGAPGTSSPAVGEGRLVIAAEDGAVYCFGPALRSSAASAFADPSSHELRRTIATADKSAGGEEAAGGGQ